MKEEGNDGLVKGGEPRNGRQGKDRALRRSPDLGKEREEKRKGLSLSTVDGEEKLGKGHRWKK